MANKAIKYRLYPTEEQAIMFSKTFGCCRKVYNLMLSDKIASYEATKTFGKQTPAMYKTEYPFLKENRQPRTGKCSVEPSERDEKPLRQEKKEAEWFPQIQVREAQPEILHDQ